MTSPVTKQDIVAGTVTWLLSKPDCTSAVSMYNIGGKVVPGIFQYRLWTTIEGSSTTAAVITYEGGWAGANLHNTMRFPRILLSIWVDPLRDTGLNGGDQGEAMRRANAVYEVFDRHLHHVAGKEMWWGDLRVISSARMAEPTITVMSEGDGTLRLNVSYAVTQG